MNIPDPETDYQCAAPYIRCRADRMGATVFEVESHGHKTRALAYNLEDAEVAAENYLREMHPALFADEEPK